MKKFALFLILFGLISQQAFADVELNGTTANKYSETAGSNTAASPNGWANGTYPNQVEPINRVTLGALQRFWNRANGALTVGGSANTITLTPSNTSFPTSYVSGELYQFKASAPNTGAVTVNINGIGAANLYKKGSAGSVALTGGEIQANDQVVISYDGTEFQIISSLPQAAVVGYLTASNNLSDVASASTSRTNLGLGTASVQNSTAFMQSANNLSDVSSLSTAVSNLGFTTSAGTNGYVKLPGGIIIQWGQSISSSNPRTVTFPLAFPNNCYSVTVTSLVSNNSIQEASAYSKTGFTLSQGNVSGNASWMAIGN